MRKIKPVQLDLFNPSTLFCSIRAEVTLEWTLDGSDCTKCATFIIDDAMTYNLFDMYKDNLVEQEPDLDKMTTLIIAIEPIVPTDWIDIFTFLEDELQPLCD